MSHAIVIGAGFGGLAAAVRLRARGYEVTLLEANDQLGGRAARFSEHGYQFDAGPTVITAPYLIAELFELVGRDLRDYVEMLPVDPFYRVAFWEGGTFDYTNDEERLMDQIREFNPADVDGYARMLAKSKDIFEIGYSQLADVPFDTVMDMLRVAPDMLKLGNYRSVYGQVAAYLQDERLRQVFTFQPLLIGGNPFRCSSIYLLIHWLERKWGVWFPKGGTHALVNAFGQLLAELGVDVHTSKPVAEIVVGDNGQVTGVRTEDGEHFAADVVVSNADPSFTYKHLVARKHRTWHPDWRIDSVRQSMGLFVGYFGANGTWDDVAHHTILLGPRYKGLLHDIFDRRVLADDFSLYLHNPVVTDPTMAPAGKASCYVLSPVPNQKSGIDWDEVGPGYMDRILDAVETRAMPGLRDKLEVNFHLTPRYFQETLRSVDGSGFGPEPTLTQSAWFRYHNRSEDVGNLFFVGAGTHPGAGVPGVLSSARVLEHVVPEPRIAAPIPHMAPRAAK